MSPPLSCPPAQDGASPQRHRLRDRQLILPAMILPRAEEKHCRIGPAGPTYR